MCSHIRAAWFGRESSSDCFGVRHQEDRQITWRLPWSTFTPPRSSSMTCPAMDDAEHAPRGSLRHTLHSGKSIAILVALALINRAYPLHGAPLPSCPPEFRDTAPPIWKSTWARRSLNGQSHDLHYSQLCRTPSNRGVRRQGKTVSLISLAAGSSGHRCRSDPARVAIARIASATFWGLSYQILDDLKDVLETPPISVKRKPATSFWTGQTWPSPLASAEP